MIKNEVSLLSTAIWGVISNISGPEVLDDIDHFSQTRKCEFFKVFPDRQLAELLRKSEVRKLASGTHLVTEKIVGNSFFVLLSGSATIISNGMHMGIIHRGECAGEDVLLADSQHSPITVVANGEATVLEIDKQDVELLSSETKGYMDRALLQALYRKLKHSNIMKELLHKQWISSFGRQT